MLAVSVQICTLNEDSNIAECLSSVFANSPAEVLVIDGGSSDNTVSIARDKGATVIEAGRVGLAGQRQLGINSTNMPFVAIVDADDRLERNCISTLLREIEMHNFKAIQANVQSFSRTTYWQNAWSFFCENNINSSGPSNMVGRPALFERAAIVTVGFDPFFTYGSEDTDISYRFEKRGFAQGIGTGVSLRIHPTQFNECRKKWRSYGRGYARFKYRHPEKTRAMIKHVLWNIPIKRMFRAIVEGKIAFAPFFLLYGFYCSVGFFEETIELRRGILRTDLGR